VINYKKGLFLNEKLVRVNPLLFLYKTLYAMLKKPTAQIAHLVFADTQANAEKPKELFFANARQKKKKI
jgi:hypothetical protein